MLTANDVRGEVDLELDGQRFILRPSYTAILAIEKQTAIPIVQLAMLADGSALLLDHIAICVTEMVRAFGRSIAIDEYSPVEDQILARSAKGAGKEAIGELVYAAGVMTVLPRLAIALGMAASGGCLPSGEPRATGETTTTETLAAA